MLSCSCPEWDGDWGSWAFFPPGDFVQFDERRRKRCSSCNALIDIGAQCLKFDRLRSPYNEVEERIAGDEIPMAPLYQCEKCGEIFLNLDAVGYCHTPQDNMREAMEGYWELTGFKPGESADA